jgi:BlaI family penicillinase repressor
MKRNKSSKPTEAELAILAVLWQFGSSTVRDIWEHIGARQGTGYTTTLKTMQIMFEKGLLERDARQRSHVYRAAFSEEQTQRQVVGHLLERVFAGSAPKLVMHALAGRKATRAELAEIRKLLDKMEGNSK